MAKNTFFDVKEMTSFIKKNNSFALFCHTCPDEDALGSLLAMKYILKSLGKQAKIYCDGEVPDNIKYLHIHLDEDTEYISSCDVVLMLDANMPYRLGKYSEYFENGKKKAKIDHHIPLDYTFDCELAESTSPSTCDIVFDLARAMNVEITTELASYLYAGIASDTGCFVHPSTTEQSLYNAYELFKTSFDSSKANYYLFKYKRQDHLNFLKAMLKNTKSYYNGDLLITYISHRLYKKYQKSYEICSFSFLDGIDGNKIACRICEKDKGILHVSLRSQNKCNVFNIAKTYGGGGHVNASGFEINSKMNKFIAGFIDTCKKELQK